MAKPLVCDRPNLHGACWFEGNARTEGWTPPYRELNIMLIIRRSFVAATETRFGDQHGARLAGGPEARLAPRARCHRAFAIAARDRTR